MIPAPFDYVRAESADHAVQLLGEHGDDAKLLAGGHSLLPLMKLRLASPAVLVDVGRLTDLSYVRDAGDHVAVGALTRHHDLETSDVLAEHLPLLRHAAGQVGDPQVRHRGTIGGSLAHGDPASDLPAVLLALRATMVVRGPKGDRDVPIDSFFTGFLETALRPDEVLVEMRVPKMAGAGWSFQKFNRRAQDWAIVGVACVCNGATGVALVNMDRRRSGPARWRTRSHRARRRPMPPPSPTATPSRRPTSTRRPSTAGTWPGSSCGAPSRRPQAGDVSISSATLTATAHTASSKAAMNDSGGIVGNESTAIANPIHAIHTGSARVCRIITPAAAVAAPTAIIEARNAPVPAVLMTTASPGSSL